MHRTRVKQLGGISGASLVLVQAFPGGCNEGNVFCFFFKLYIL